MSEYTREIAKIKSTHLGGEDHGIFTAMVDVDYGGAGQGIGGYGLDAYDKATKKRIGTRYGMEWIMRFLRACGVSRWEDLEGRTIYVLFGKERHRPVGVEPLPTERGERFIFDDIKHLADQ